MAIKSEDEKIERGGSFIMFFSRIKLGGGEQLWYVIIIYNKVAEGLGK